MDHFEALRALDSETARARRSMRAERMFAAARWALAALVFWLSASLLGFHAVVPPLVGTIATIGALALLLGLVWRARALYREPTAADARARLSARSGFDAAAARLLEDRPASMDPIGLALWRREQANAAARAVAFVPPSRHAVDWRAVDPLRLRFLAVVLLVAAAVVAGEDVEDRLAHAVLPDPGPLVGDRPLRVEAWATPADYTGAGPVSLTDRLDQTVTTPPSPTITVRLTGPVSPPRLAIVTETGRRELRFARAADGAFEAEARMDEPGRLEVIRFFVKARWRIAPAPDAPPTARFGAAPTIDGTTITAPWRVDDDFGVRRLLLRLTPIDPPAGLAVAAGVDTPLDLPAGDPRSAEGQAKVDLAQHPYAGLLVEARIVSVDAAGQEGASLPVSLRLPEPIFLQPLAQAAIEIRTLILHERRAYAAPSDATVSIDGFGRRVLEPDDRLRRAPAAIRKAGDMLDALTMAPEDGYFSDLAVYGGLRLARSMLDVAREIEDTDAAADVLWNVALRAEHGASADARRALDTAQSRLSDALRRGAGREEIAALSEALKSAMAGYLESLAREAAENPEPRAEADDAADGSQSLGSEDLEQMLADIEAQAAAGDHAGAQRMLQAFTRMLGDLEVRLTEGEPRPGEAGSEGGTLEQALDALSRQIGAQRALRDETAGAANGEDREKSADLAERQAELSEDLRDAQRDARAGGARAGMDDLDAAQEAMGRAQRQLERGEPSGAALEQDAALRRLRQAADSIAEEARGGGGEGDRGDLDPLGRSMGGPGDTTGAVPSEIDRQRAREILDELRRRAQDATRPESERDYLRRLLDRFTES